MLSDRRFEAGPGTLVTLPRGTVHAFWKASAEPLRALLFVGQGGFESCFVSVAVSLREQPPPANPEVANARIGATAAEHGSEIRPDLTPEGLRSLYAAD